MQGMGREAAGSTALGPRSRLAGWESQLPRFRFAQSWTLCLGFVICKMERIIEPPLQGGGVVQRLDLNPACAWTFLVSDCTRGRPAIVIPTVKSAAAAALKRIVGFRCVGSSVFVQKNQACHDG